MKSINEIVTTLSAEEREMYKGLIEECQIRESVIIENEIQSKELLKNMFIATQLLEKNLRNIPEQVNRLAEINRDLEHDIKAYVLQSIPEHDFYHE